MAGIKHIAHKWKKEDEARKPGRGWTCFVQNRFGRISDEGEKGSQAGPKPKQRKRTSRDGSGEKKDPEKIGRIPLHEST